MGRTRRCGGKVIDGEAFMYIPDICRGKIIKDREKESSDALATGLFLWGVRKYERYWANAYYGRDTQL